MEPAMVDDAADAVDDDDAGTIDKISGLPDDVLLDMILGRLIMAGDVRTVARTSILSRRWRSLPWPEIPRLSLNVGSFFVDSDEWCLVKGWHRFWKQHHATAGLTDALARFLAAPASKRVIERLSLKFILTRRDYVRRIGELVGDASATGRVKGVELEIVTEMSCSSSGDIPLMVGYSERFRDFFKDCPGAFRCVTKLTLQFLWFEDQDALRDLVRSCDALEFLSLVFCGLLRPRSPEADMVLPAVLTIDAPRSRLETLVCDRCYIERVELVQAPALKSLSIRHRSFPGQWDIDAKWKLSELLVRDGSQIESLRFEFENNKIWLQPEYPRHLRAALGGLKELHLREISPGYNLSWALFLLEASPLLESLDIHISDHICRGEWRKKRDENTDLTWKLSTDDFMHYSLKKLSFQRAFNLYKDMVFARQIMKLAVNLRALTFGVKTLECEDCVAAEPNFPDPARSRLRSPENNEHVDAVVKKLKAGISTSVQITIHLPD